ncbi:auxin efflux carrier [Ampelomyces quisqualis]|uniref:Auxin efflux carrier n=1 Tax=Ampelomyces quisqualis TaxID=50730 RepID=A0A6A5QUS7_AMPQU|nr:auxin efflux carrier [Ampelomyces quisqualis]
MGPLLSSFVAAVQASLSVLLVISYGGIAAKLGLLNSQHGKAISKICVKMFLPALLLVQIGSELHLGSANRYLIVLLWAFICHLISFLIGIFAHLVFGLPDWVMAALMFNNTTSYPLLLIQSLDATGILVGLAPGDEDTLAMIERAKSYFLVFATVSSCLTFAVGPRLIDTEHAPESDDDHKSLDSQEDVCDTEDVPSGADGDFGPGWPNEQTGLLTPDRQRTRHQSVVAITFFPSKPKFTTVKRRPWYIKGVHWSDLSPHMKWWLLFLYDFLNAPLLGAVLGAIVGLTPPLHRAFFAKECDGGIFTAWLTESWKNVGGLFVPLPLIVAGISLYTSYQESKQGDNSRTAIPLATTVFILVVRFLLWPVFSIGVIYAIVHRQGMSGILGSDPMLWFAMMLMPTGPPAMKLITMIQVSDAGPEDERCIAKILTIAYIFSPALAFTVVGALRASQAAM